MPQQYFAILTAVGEAKDANAKALGIPLVITEMAVGDGNGALPVPDKTRTALVRQVRRAPLNQLSRDPVNTNQVIAEQVIPENVGGWWIREIGLYDADGDLVAIGNCPESYKPQLAEGSGRTQVVRMVLIISSADSVQLKVDPAVVLATRQYADTAITASMTAHLAAVDPHPQYLNTAEGNAMIAAAVAALVNSSPATLDTLAELATALGNDPSFATTITNALALKAPIASPTLTGTPLAPTPALFDDSTKIATTEFARRLGHLYRGLLDVAVSSNLALSNVGGLVRVTASGTTQTLPAIAGVPVGQGLCIMASHSAGSTIIKGNAAESINSGIVGVTANTYPLLPGDNVFFINAGGSWVAISSGLQYTPGNIIQAKTYYDAGSGTSSTSYTNAQGTYFNFTPRRADSVIYGVYSYLSNQNTVNGVNYGYSHNVFEAVGSSYVAVDMSNSLAYTNGGVTPVGIEGGLHFTHIPGNTAARQYCLRHAITNGVGGITSSLIRCLILEVLP